MVKESPADTAVNGLGWLQDQVYQLKGHVGQLEQELEHLRAMATHTTESLRAVETSLREASTRSGGASRRGCRSCARTFSRSNKGSKAPRARRPADWKARTGRSTR